MTRAPNIGQSGNSRLEKNYPYVMSELYKQAAVVLDRIQAKQGSLKNIILSSKLYRNKKQLYAIVCRTLECMIFQ